jgi:hypothetical protein
MPAIRIPTFGGHRLCGTTGVGLSAGFGGRSVTDTLDMERLCNLRLTGTVSSQQVRAFDFGVGLK